MTFKKSPPKLFSERVMTASLHNGVCDIYVSILETDAWNKTVNFLKSIFGKALYSNFYASVSILLFKIQTRSSLFEFGFNLVKNVVNFHQEL